MRFFSDLPDALLFIFSLVKKIVNRLLLILSSLALVASIPLSLSRTLFFSLGVSLVFGVISALNQPRYFTRIVYTLIGIGLLVIVLSQTQFFQTASEAFTFRLQDANESEGGLQGVLGNRYLGGLMKLSLTLHKYLFSVWYRYGYECWQHFIGRAKNIFDCRSRMGQVDWRNGTCY